MGDGEADRRRIPLAGGRTLAIRAVQPADVDALTALYTALDQQDAHRRFFSVFRPERAFFERMTTVEVRGGYGLVATVTREDGGEELVPEELVPEELVAEAGYTRLPNGDGELAITVAAPWRGWLGPYLLDALLDAAAERGVPNLEADVLVTNGPMLALFRSRGYATIDHPDATVMRVLIGSSGPAPSWAGPHDRPRVLVEAPGGRWHAEEAARGAGLQVVVCPGPTARTSRCPALHGQACPLAAEADAIVLSHPRADDEQWRGLPAAHEAQHRGVPVCVEPTAGAEPSDLPVVPRGGESEVVAFVQRLARHKARAASEDRTIDPSPST